MLHKLLRWWSCDRKFSIAGLLWSGSDRSGTVRPWLEVLEDRLAPATLQQTLVDPNPPGRFGGSVASDGNWTVVGSPLAADQGFTATGLAYVFNSTSGLLVATLHSPTPAGNEAFGYSVAVSGDTVVVGAPNGSNAGSAYLFDVSTGNLLHTLNNPNPGFAGSFGTGVAVSGNTVVVGDESYASETGAAYIFDAGTGNLLQTLSNPTPAPGDRYGLEVAVSGNTVVVGSYGDDTNATDAGSAYLFDASTGNLLHTLNNPNPHNYDDFGLAVAVSGNTVVVGAPAYDTGGVYGVEVGAVYVFDAGTGNLVSTLNNPLAPLSDDFGRSVAVSGDTLVVGTAGQSSAGPTYVYCGDTATLLATLDNPTPAPGSRYFQAVALSGNTAVVGASNDVAPNLDVGATYLYDISAETAQCGSAVTAVEGANSGLQTVATFTGVLSFSSFSINWGDGTAPSLGTIRLLGGTLTVMGSHTYGEEGTYTITTTVNHGVMPPTVATTMATVSDPAVVASSAGVSTTPGMKFTGQVVATFTDPGGAEPNGSDPVGPISNHYAATIAWGDGSTSAGTITPTGGNTFTVRGDHSYGTAGTYTVTTTINHEGVVTTTTTTLVSYPPEIYNTTSSPLCGCSFPIDSTANSQDTGGEVYLYDGESHQTVTGPVIVGRGFNYQFVAAYRSGVQFDGAMGNNWDFQDNRRLRVVTAQNLAEILLTFDEAKVGDVVRLTGLNRADLYFLNADGSFTAPHGFFTSLVLNADGTYRERDQAGTVYSYAPQDVRGFAVMTSMADRNGNATSYQRNALGQLVQVIDTLGRPINFSYLPDGHLAEVSDFDGRSLQFSYDANGDLHSVTSPTVTGTPNGNDFPTGQTQVFTYSSGFADPRLNHNLLTVTAPNEVAAGGPPRVVLSYDDNPASPNVDRVLSLTLGGTNAQGVAAGGTISYRYRQLATANENDVTTPVFQTTVLDRNDDLTQYQFNMQGDTLQEKQYNTEIVRAGDPAFYQTSFTYNIDYQVLQVVFPQGNSIVDVYDSSNPDRYEQGNLLSTTQLPDASRGGDQTALTTTYTYEPIYNQVHTETDPRGADSTYVPPNGTNSPGRYQTVYTFDYQQGTNFAALAASLGVSVPRVQQMLASAGIAMGLGDVNGSGQTGQVAGNVIRIDHPAVNLLAGSNEAMIESSSLAFSDSFTRPNSTKLGSNYEELVGNLVIQSNHVATTSALDLATYTGAFVSDVSVKADVALAATGMSSAGLIARYAGPGDSNMYLGMLGGTAGNANASIWRFLGGIWKQLVSATASTGSGTLRFDVLGNSLSLFLNGVLVTSTVDSSIRGPGGTGLRGHAATFDNFSVARLVCTSQPIEELKTYNQFGQLTRYDDPEGNVTFYTYYSEQDPNGDGMVDNPAGNPVTGGYLMQEVQDAVSAPGRDSGTNPAPANIRSTYQYDAVGNVTRTIDGRGIATDFVFNALNEVVQVVHASAHGLYGADPTEPLALTDFAYLQRFFYDYNGNLVLSQTEDRDNTSNVDGNPPAADLPVTAPNPDPVGGTAFVDTVFKYDILDQQIETLQEVSNGAAPEFLRTLVRYDARGYQVLLIQPEGNATSFVYDNRGLLFQETSGAIAPPPDVLLAAADPTNYDVRGGLPATKTWNYDLNGNVTEIVDAADTDGSAANNSKRAGVGDRTRYLRDGFDRVTAIIDSVGNETVNQYDPASNIVRVLHFGPVGGPSPTTDGPDLLPGPVSTGGVIQAANLVSRNLLSVTENSFDELGRPYQTDQVLFVNTVATQRTPDVAEGATDLGKGALTPGLTQAIPGFSGVRILGRVSERQEYDRDSRPTFLVQDDRDTSSTAYDGAGRVIKTTDPEGNTVENAYDANSNLIETRTTDVSQLPGIASEVFLTTSFYDSLNRLQQRVDNLGETIDYRYDSRNNLVAQADASGPPGPAIARRAFTGGALTVNTTNLFGNVTLFYYDGLDRQTQQEIILTASGQGDGVHIGADIFGIKGPTPTPDPAQGGGDGMIRVATVWAGKNWLAAKVDDQGNVTLYLHDDLNNTVVETEGLTVASTLSKAVILGSRTVPTPTVATLNKPATIPAAEIDAQLAEIKAGLNAVAALFPPLANRVDDQPPATTVYGYDPNGNILFQEDPNGSDTYFKYDASNRLIAVRVFRAGQNDSFVGDTIFAPAPVNRPPFPGPMPTKPVVGTTRQNFEYNGLSQQTRATDNNDPTTTADDSVVTDAFDSLGRVIEETQQIGTLPAKVVSYAWRAEDLQKCLTYPNGRVELFTYDHDDRLKTVTDRGATQPIAVYVYIGGGDRVLERLYPLNGTLETYLNNAGTADIGYDGVQRPIQLRDLGANNTLLVGFTYHWDRMGNKLTEGKLHDPANSETYSYDSAYRLISFQRGVGGLTPLQSRWVLDGAGNWTQVNGKTQQFSSTNELIQSNSGTGAPPTPILYDNNGNEIDDGTFTYTYDADNRLRTVTRKAGGLLIAGYSYDAEGRRIRKVVTNSGALNGTTDFSLDGMQEIEERSSAGLQQYVFGAFTDEPVLLVRPSGQRLFYEQNALLSVYALTDTTGAIVEKYLYDAYGRPTILVGNRVVIIGGSSTVGNPFLFTGKRRDAETGLYYYGTRYLDSIAGRFLSRDTIGVWGDETALGNGYTFVGNNPTNYVDSLGTAASVNTTRSNIKNSNVAVAGPGDPVKGVKTGGGPKASLSVSFNGSGHRPGPWGDDSFPFPLPPPPPPPLPQEAIEWRLLPPDTTTMKKVPEDDPPLKPMVLKQSMAMPGGPPGPTPTDPGNPFPMPWPGGPFPGPYNPLPSGPASIVMGPPKLPWPGGPDPTLDCMFHPWRCNFPPSLPMGANLSNPLPSPYPGPYNPFPGPWDPFPGPYNPFPFAAETIVWRLLPPDVVKMTTVEAVDTKLVLVLKH